MKDDQPIQTQVVALFKPTELHFLFCLSTVKMAKKGKCFCNKSRFSDMKSSVDLLHVEITAIVLLADKHEACVPMAHWVC